MIVNYRFQKIAPYVIYGFQIAFEGLRVMRLLHFVKTEREYNEFLVYVSYN